MSKSDSQVQNSALPEGTVTFLFTDIVGSTELLKALGDRYAELLEDQRGIVRAGCEEYGGTEVDTQGDSFFLSFPRATQAISAAVQIQREIQKQTWPEGVEVHLRMGLHTGEPLTWAEGYVGMDVHRAARIAAVGHGGQVLLSEPTTALIRDLLPGEVGLRSLGSHKLKDIPQPEPIHQLVIEGVASDFPPLASLDSRPNNLPVQLTPFVGRLDELEDLEGLIANPDNRLISIIGPGGMGKTRLAIALAERQLHMMITTNGEKAPRFPDGAFFIALAPLETAEAILPTLGKVLGLHFSEGDEPKKQILDYLRWKRMLLVMDNYEHLREGMSLPAEIVREARDIRILVTSRAKLDLQVEVPYLLNGMSFPQEGEVDTENETFSAVDLFLERANRLVPDYLPNAEERRSIGDICRQVEGMPLGVELAAAWIEILSTKEIAAEIQENLDFLATEKDDVPERHRSIRAVFKTTWNLLREDEQEILKQISVFRGGLTIEAAHYVARGSNKQLLGLVNKSLLQRSSTGRLTIHELLRQYAAEKLGQDRSKEDEALNRHCEYFAEFVHDREVEIDGGDYLEAFENLDNIRTAWYRAVSEVMLPEIRKLYLSFVNLNDFQGWYKNAEREFRWAVEKMHQNVPEGERGKIYGMLLADLGFFTYRSGELSKGLELVLESRGILSRLGAHEELIWSDVTFGIICAFEDSQKAMEYIEEDLAGFEGEIQPLQEAYIVNLLGGLNVRKGNLDAGEGYYRQGLHIGRMLNNRRSIAWSTAGLVSIASTRGDFIEARKCAEFVVHTFRSTGYKNMVGASLVGLGNQLNMLGEHEAALEKFVEAIAIFDEIGKNDQLPIATRGLGNCAFEMGEYMKAKDYSEQALAQLNSLEEPDVSEVGHQYYALGKVAVALQDMHEAQKRFLEVLEIGLDLKSERLCLIAIEGISTLLFQKGELVRPIHYASLIVNHPTSDPFTREYGRRQLSKFEGELPPDKFNKAQEHGKALDLWATVEQLQLDLKG